jgi:hypothetical protein
MFTKLDLNRFIKDIQNAKESVYNKVFQEQEVSAIEIVSNVKILLNSTPAAGGKIGRIVTGRLINSYHFESAKKPNYNYRDKKGQSFDGKFKSTRPSGNVILIGSNVVYADKIEQMDKTFAQAFDAGSKSMIQRINKILK